MKRILLKAFLSLAILLAAAILIFAQNDSPDAPVEKTPLVLTATVLSQKCLHWNKNLAEVNLSLRFTNEGDQPLILNKRDITIIREKYFSFIDEEKNEAHIGETATCSLRGYEPEFDEELVSDYPNAHFVVLSPGQSYVLEEVTSVPLITLTASSGMSGNRTDTYQVEIEVSTWAALNPKLADELRRRWEKVGTLWSESIWSKPIELTFERNRTCEK